MISCVYIQSVLLLWLTCASYRMHYMPFINVLFAFEWVKFLPYHSFLASFLSVLLTGRTETNESEYERLWVTKEMECEKKRYRRMWLTTARWQETRNESSKLLLLSKVSYSPSSWLESVWHEAEPCLWGTERPVMSFRWKSVRQCYLASI